MFIHEYIIFSLHSASFTLSLYPPPLPLVPTPRQDLFCLPVLWFCKPKKGHFYLFKRAIQGVSLGQFHIYIYLICIY
jgi:hypothetical protein